MRFRPSKLFRDAFASCLWSAPVFGILWYVRLTYGRDAMYDVFAAITAWGILAALIFAFRGEGQGPETRSLEGPGEGLSGVVCGQCGLPKPEDQRGMIGCLGCGNLLNWRLVGDPVQVQSEEGDGE